MFDATIKNLTIDQAIASLKRAHEGHNQARLLKLRCALALVAGRLAKVSHDARKGLGKRHVSPVERTRISGTCAECAKQRSAIGSALAAYR